jgi:hypothetical protein
MIKPYLYSLLPESMVKSGRFIVVMLSTGNFLSMTEAAIPAEGLRTCKLCHLLSLSVTATNPATVCYKLVTNVTVRIVV